MAVLTKHDAEEAAALRMQQRVTAYGRLAQYRTAEN